MLIWSSWRWRCVKSLAWRGRTSPNWLKNRCNKSASISVSPWRHTWASRHTSTARVAQLPKARGPLTCKNYSSGCRSARSWSHHRRSNNRCNSKQSGLLMPKLTECIRLRVNATTWICLGFPARTRPSTDTICLRALKWHLSDPISFTSSKKTSSSLRVVQAFQ